MIKFVFFCCFFLFDVFFFALVSHQSRDVASVD
jgi:hypothetical protein